MFLGFLSDFLLQEQIILSHRNKCTNLIQKQIKFLYNSNSKSKSNSWSHKSCINTKECEGLLQSIQAPPKTEAKHQTAALTIACHATRSLEIF